MKLNNMKFTIKHLSKPKAVLALKKNHTDYCQKKGKLNCSTHPWLMKKRSAGKDTK